MIDSCGTVHCAEKLNVAYMSVEGVGALLGEPGHVDRAVVGMTRHLVFRR